MQSVFLLENMQKTVAVIDLGTNTFNLLIAEISATEIKKKLLAHEFPVKLGEGGINEGYISEAAYKRGLKTMSEIKKIIISLNIDLVKAVATSAIRSASNGREFIQAVKLETGIEITTVDGDREAELIFKGVRAASGINTPALIMDIGGGSIEFIIADKNDILWKQSYAIGVARLKDQFHHTDPISSTDQQAIIAYLEGHLAEIFENCRLHKPSRLIGSAGAFETFAEMAALHFGHDTDPGQPYVEFNMDEFHVIADRIIASHRNEREKMPGLVSFRVDMIVVAAIITRYVLAQTGISVMTLSYYSLKEGLLAEMLQ